MSAGVLVGIWASALALLAEVFAGALLFAWHLPRRSRLAGRVAGVLGAFAVLSLAITVVGAALHPAWAGAAGTQAQPLGDGPSSWMGTVALCAALLLVQVPALRACFSADGWAALFCAVCGYTLQNFSSGLGELVARLAGDALPPVLAGLPLTALCCAVCYPAFWLALVRRVNPSVLRRETNPLLATMTVATILAVIGFDVVLKGDAVAGLPLPAYVPLRVVHGLVCAFVLVVNVAIVANGQLRTERDMARRVADERERQYAASREAIDAVNARLHDVRHAVAGLLGAEGAGVDRGLLAQVLREIRVYDAHVHTGSPVLDTVLTEKGLVCARRGVSLTATADGHALDALAPEEAFALLSLALDGAVADAAACGPGHRGVTLTLRRAAGAAILHVECYAGLAERAARAAWHEADLRETAARHHGTLSLVRQDGTATLDVLLPQETPQAQ